MNYIQQIRAFYDLQMTNPLSTGQIALWQALMHINNKCTWIEWFTVPNQTLELLTGLSRQAIAKARNTLKQYNYIDFKSNGTKATSYTIKLLYTSNSLQASLQDDLQGSVQDSLQGGLQNSRTLNKQNKTKLNIKKDTKVSKKDLPVICESEEWQGYVAMRKQMKKPLTERAVDLAVKKLEQLAPNNLEKQKAILDQSTERGWLGLFELKDFNKPNTLEKDYSQGEDFLSFAEGAGVNFV